jgi:hypothetical protein
VTPLILRHASARPFGQWRDDDYDVLEGGVVVGRIFSVARRAAGSAVDVGERARRADRPRGARLRGRRASAMAAFAKSWRRPRPWGGYRPAGLYFLDSVPCRLLCEVLQIRSAALSLGRQAHRPQSAPQSFRFPLRCGPVCRKQLRIRSENIGRFAGDFD